MIKISTLSDWDTHWFKQAKLTSERSKDPSTKCGAVIVDGKFLVSVGYNGFPQHTNDSPALYEDRERKYARVLHSELNAILTAKRDLKGMSLYCTHPCCSQCMAAIIQSGIIKVFVDCPDKSFMDRWENSADEASLMAKEAGINYYIYTGGLHGRHQENKA